LSHLYSVFCILFQNEKMLPRRKGKNKKKD